MPLISARVAICMAATFSDVMRLYSAEEQVPRATSNVRRKILSYAAAARLAIVIEREDEDLRARLRMRPDIGWVAGGSQEAFYWCTSTTVASDKIMLEYIIRFLVGGIAVSLFSLVGDVLRPKSFAGLLGSAPSIAMVTLALTTSTQGPADAELEARSMMFGAVALGLYSAGVCHLMSRRRVPALLATVLMLPVWFGCAFALEWFLAGAA